MRKWIIIFGTLLAFGGIGIQILSAWRQCEVLPRLWTDCMSSLVTGALAYYGGILIITIVAFGATESKR